MPSSGLSDTNVIKAGYLRKVKSWKKRYFVLCGYGERGGPARLEYYPSQRRYRLGGPPRRAVYLSNCLSVARKPGLGLVLYLRAESLALAANSQEEQDQWMEVLLDQVSNPDFEQVWAVKVRNKGLGVSKVLPGLYHLGLNATSLMFFRAVAPLTFEFPLTSIRKCGHSGVFFFLEMGRSAVTGPGELWLQTEARPAAQSMHEAVLRAMKLSKMDPRPSSMMCCPPNPSGCDQSSTLSTSLPSEEVSTPSSSSPSMTDGPQLLDYLPMDTSSLPDSPSTEAYLQMKPLVSEEYLPMSAPTTTSRQHGMCHDNKGICMLQASCRGWFKKDNNCPDLPLPPFPGVDARTGCCVSST